MAGWNSICTYLFAIFITAEITQFVSAPKSAGSNAATADRTSLSEPSSSDAEPRVLKLSLSLSSLQELKVGQGQSILASQVIADRTEERSRLVAQRQELVLSLNKIQQVTVPGPLEPKPVPEVKELPPISYDEEEAAIAAAGVNVRQAERELAREQDKLREQPAEASTVRRVEAIVKEKQRLLDNQNRKIDAVHALKDLPPNVLLHEREVLKQKEADLQQVQADLQEAQEKVEAARKDRVDRVQHLAMALEKAKSEQEIAISKLQTAKDRRAYQEYEASITAVRRTEEHEQTMQSYGRQLQETENRERDRSFQAAQIQAKVAELDDQLASLGIIRSPYAGTIQRIKVTGQNDKNISVEVTLATSAVTSSAAFSSQSESPQATASVGR
jgi:DNA repair exonuclease SbcCD ATPase subunit